VLALQIDKGTIRRQVKTREFVQRSGLVRVRKRVKNKHWSPFSFYRNGNGSRISNMKKTGPTVSNIRSQIVAGEFRLRSLSGHPAGAL